MIATWLLGWKWLKTIGIKVNRSKPKAFAVAEKMKRELEKRGVDVCFEPDIAADLGYPDLGLPLEEFANRVELVFVLGGDGTLLGVARQLARYQIPILGFNLGNLGFLSEAETGGLSEAIERVLSGDYVIECRLMLEAEVIRNGRVIETGVALNDVGIAKGSFGRMITCTAYMDGNFLGTYTGDGVIISTPTGSTAYSLSCGGPIVYPGIRALLLTPICSHTLTSRPMVLPSESVIDIHVSAVHREMGITIDGQIGYCLKEGDIVRVKRYKHSALLIKWQDRSFFEVVRQKLQGESVDVSRVGGEHEGTAPY
ncbi:NAD+ kinase [Thermoactinomyces vulgaris]|jgi:NAD+ kinase|nr:NAD(+)/NADH kinase [Thermoactinomyces vulgaris]RMB04100.1 NAD+ kinase [Thermoactinomyces vulgaris]